MTDQTTKQRRPGHAPEWANVVLAIMGDEYKPNQPLPELRWQRSSKAHRTTGTTYHALGNAGRYDGTCSIAITQGACKVDAFCTVVHEACHWLVGHEAAHNNRFWAAYWQAALFMELPLRWCYYNEGTYKKQSMYVAQRFFNVPAQWFQDVHLMWNTNRRHLLPNYNPQQYGLPSSQFMRSLFKKDLGL